MEIINRYAEIKAQIKLLTDEAKELEPQVSELVSKEENEKLETDAGKFYFTTRKSWEYPSYVKEAETKFKEEKKKAEDNGDAKFEESKSLTFKAN